MSDIDKFLDLIDEINYLISSCELLYGLASLDEKNKLMDLYIKIQYYKEDTKKYNYINKEEINKELISKVRADRNTILSLTKDFASYYDSLFVSKK